MPHLMLGRPWVHLAAVAAAALTAPLGCGPSVQSIYEGNVRFEHCYRLDLEQEVASTHRQACWTTWLDRYTYGQSRDKLEYARRRVRAFGSGDLDRPALKIGEGDEQQRDARQFYLVVPAPTSVHAPPPPIATRVNAVEPPPLVSAQPLAKQAPGETCASECLSAFNSCNQACDSAAKSVACKSCDPDYKKCMQRCFE
jgi:hypothetical protein